VSVVGLHPEELIDRERRGELSELERERLESHMAHCSACRIERQMRADFADDLDAETEDVPLPSLAGIFPRHAPAPSHEAQAPGAPVPVPALRTGRGTLGVVVRPRTVWLLVAAALVVVSAAAGAGVRGRTWLHLMTSMFVAEPAPADVLPAAPVQAKPARASLHTAPAQVQAQPLDATEAPEEAAREATPSAAPVAVGLVSPLVVEAPRAEAKPADAPRPAALFDSARAARQRGDYARVLALHRELVARYPQSREAQASRATVGQLLLDRGDPGGALASFDAFLSPGNASVGGLGGSGQLTELALAGRATALDRLGRSDEALNAWRALVVAFPDTPYARHAAARLGATLPSTAVSSGSGTTEP
jgi:TolA-binding protein